MNHKVIDLIFALIAFSLPFKYTPRIIWQLFWGGPYGQYLIVYPLMAGVLYTAYAVMWKGFKLPDWRIFQKFLFAYIGVLIFSLAWGAYSYPYYEQVLSGPATQIRQLPAIMEMLTSIGVAVDEKTVMLICIILRPIKGIFFDTLYTFGAAYMIYVWYQNRVQRAVQILLKVVTLDLVLIAGYGLIDVCYQNGQLWAQNVLEFVTPLLHADVTMKWTAERFTIGPFWNGQVRSLFLEPSYFGNFMAFALPLLWWNICRKHSNGERCGLALLLLILTFELFLTKSRTSVLILAGEIIIYAAIVMWRRNIELIKLSAVLAVTCMLGFSFALAFMNYGQVHVAWMGGRQPLATIQAQGMEGNVSLGNYFESTYGTLLNDTNVSREKQESNHSRYTIAKTGLSVGEEHLLLGVGKTMRHSYFREKLDDDPTAEIQMWNKMIDANGLLGKMGYPDLNAWTDLFAETGGLGVVLYCLPMIIVLRRYLKNVLDRSVSFENAIPSVFCGISFVGMLVSGFGDSITLTFCPWLMLGISFLVCQKEG